uniref:Uncharacterized protein n=1 Tax=Romanomermis culicivorax TaxID=13658 RepID=A0A915JJZ9_ROMCU
MIIDYCAFPIQQMASEPTVQRVHGSLIANPREECDLDIHQQLIHDRMQKPFEFAVECLGHLKRMSRVAGPALTAATMKSKRSWCADSDHNSGTVGSQSQWSAVINEVNSLRDDSSARIGSIAGEIGPSAVVRGKWQQGVGH